MHFQPRKNRYIASNVRLEMGDMSAWSYDWWCFLRIIDGKLVYNSYKYSTSTAKHQRDVLHQLAQLGHTPSLYVECPAGLQSFNWKQSILDQFDSRIEEKKAYLKKKGIRKTTRARLELELMLLTREKEVKCQALGIEFKPSAPIKNQIIRKQEYSIGA